MSKNNNNRNLQGIRKLTFKCYYCTKKFNTQEQYSIHNSGTHPEEPKQPNLGMINILRTKWNYNIEPKGNPWE